MRRTSKDQLSCGAKALASGLAALYLLAPWNGTRAAQPPAAGKTPAKKTVSQPVAETPPPLAAPFTNKFLSTFSAENPRDPFHPQLKPKASSQPVLTGVSAEGDHSRLISAIQAGFQGIYGTGEERVVMVHGVLVPENVETTIVVQGRKLKVKALKVFRNAAELKVEGLAETVQVPKTR